MFNLQKSPRLDKAGLWSVFTSGWVCCLLCGGLIQFELAINTLILPQAQVGLFFFACGKVINMAVVMGANSPLGNCVALSVWSLCNLGKTCHLPGSVS